MTGNMQTGNIVYIAGRRSGLRIVDVSNPEATEDITMDPGPLPPDGFTVRLRSTVTASMWRQAPTASTCSTSLSLEPPSVLGSS